MVNRDKLNEAVSLLNSEASDAFINELESKITEALEIAKGEKLAKIESAVQLNLKEKQELESILNKLFKKQLKTIYEVKANLLGGFKIAVGDWKLDASLITQLNLLKANIGGII